jgi:hypothetical protein
MCLHDAADDDLSAGVGNGVDVELEASSRNLSTSTGCSGDASTACVM